MLAEKTSFIVESDSEIKLEDLKLRRRELRQNFWIQIAAFVFTIITLVFGYCQVNKQILANNNLEFKKHLWEQRVEVYTKMGTTISNLINADKNTQFDSIYIEYSNLYWGMMTLFDDPDVNRLMIKFKDKIEAVKEGYEYEPYKLREASEKLMIACRKSLDKTWD